MKTAGLVPIPNLEVTLRYDIDCRLFGQEDDLFLGLMLDISTSNVIDVPVDELITKGLNVVGRYVCERHEAEQEFLLLNLTLLGRISAIEGTFLQLVDTEGTTQVDSRVAFLEPRVENLNDVVTLYYGSAARKILGSLADYRRPVNTALGKLELLKATLEGFTNTRFKLVILYKSFQVSS